MIQSGRESGKRSLKGCRDFLLDQLLQLNTRLEKGDLTEPEFIEREFELVLRIERLQSLEAVFDPPPSQEFIG